jgi:23S rRNA (adenine2503-C2)-methyltransferase
VKALSDYGLAGLQRQITAWGFKASHAQRLLRNYYANAGAVAWPALKTPRGLQDRLQAEFVMMASAPAARQVAGDGTIKLLLKLADGRTVESVVMPAYREDRVAGCLSSQVGCALACDFCATAQSGFARNLSAGEMVEQFLHLRREAQAIGRRLQTVVFMGMGEPMLNLENVLEAARRIAGGDMGALGWRQITVSTVGIVPGIDAMAEADLNINLAVSLHAPDDATRAKLIPSGRRFGIEEIMAAADRFQAKNNGRPVSIQYCLLKGVNDSPAQARQLAALLAGRRMHVNLLHYSPTGVSLTGRTYEASPLAAAAVFMNELRSRRVVAHFRRPRGRDIDAACGQLRRRAAAEGIVHGCKMA